MSYISEQYFIYLLRWLLSYVVMLIPLYLLVKTDCCKSKYQEYVHLLIIQVIGSFLFYPIDLLIFK